MVGWLFGCGLFVQDQEVIWSEEGVVFAALVERPQGEKKKKGRGSKDPLTVHHTSEGAVVTDEYASLRGPLVVDSGTFLEVSVRVRVASREEVFVDALALRREGFVLLALGKLVTCGCKIRVRESLP